MAKTNRSMPKKAKTFSLLLTALLVGLMSCEQAPPGSRGKETETTAGVGVAVRSGDTGLLEARFVSEILNIGLEKLGYKIEKPAITFYPALFLAIANGELDYTPEYQHYIHAQYFENAGGEAKLQPVGVLTPNVAKSYSIDKKTASKYNITSLEQFKDPKIAKIFDSDGDGKANLVGCNPGWGCNLTIEHHLDAYGLRDTVEHDQGEYIALMVDAITRYKQGESVLYFAAPLSFVPSVLKPGEDAVELEVPFTSLPGKLKDLTEKETSLNGKNLGFAIDQNIILANKDFLAANPKAKRWFELVQIPLEDYSAESLRIQNGENSAKEIRSHAEEWVSKNQELFDRWIEEASKAESLSG